MGLGFTFSEELGIEFRENVEFCAIGMSGHQPRNCSAKKMMVGVEKNLVEFHSNKKFNY